MDKKIKLSLVVAVAENNVIGKDNKLLWHLPNDLKFFKNTTWGMPVIMGRKTFDSMGKPLVGRHNIVITRQTDWKPGNVSVVGSLEDAIAAVRETDALEGYIIGGGQVYEQSIFLADKIYLTRVHTVIEGDTFFPPIDTETFQLVSSLPFDPDDKHVFPYTFEIWERK